MDTDPVKYWMDMDREAMRIGGIQNVNAEFSIRHIQDRYKDPNPIPIGFLWVRIRPIYNPHYYGYIDIKAIK